MPELNSNCYRLSFPLSSYHINWCRRKCDKEKSILLGRGLFIFLSPLTLSILERDPVSSTKNFLWHHHPDRAALPKTQSNFIKFLILDFDISPEQYDHTSCDKDSNGIRSFLYEPVYPFSNTPFDFIRQFGFFRTGIFMIIVQKLLSVK